VRDAVAGGAELASAGGQEAVEGAADKKKGAHGGNMVSPMPMELAGLEPATSWVRCRRNPSPPFATGRRLPQPSESTGRRFATVRRRLSPLLDQILTTVSARRPPRKPLIAGSWTGGGPYRIAELASEAAFLMRSATAAGCETLIAWLPTTSTTVEPARADISRWAGGGMIRSSVATRYQLRSFAGVAAPAAGRGAGR